MLSPTDPEVRAFLQRSLVLQFATLSSKTRPFLTPLWFVVDDDTLYLTTGPETRTGKNIAKRPHVALLCSGERDPRRDRVLRLRGTATCHYGLPSWRVLFRIATKYYVSPRALPVELQHARQWRLRRLYYGQIKGGFGHIRVVPTAAEFLPRP